MTVEVAGGWILYVRRASYRGVEDTPKGGQRRDGAEWVVPMAEMLADALEAHQHCKGPYVLCQEDGQPFNEDHLTPPLRRACKRAGLSRAIRHRMDRGKSKRGTGIGWHTLRHSCATQLIRRGVHLRKVQFMMRHKSLDMTLRYAHVADESLREAADELNKPWGSDEVEAPVGHGAPVGVGAQKRRNPNSFLNPGS